MLPNMLKISVTLDLEDGPDAINVLGDLIISDEQSKITLETTFLDSWLIALMEVLPRLSTADHLIVEVDEEPKPLRLDIDADERILVSYEHEVVVAQTLAELIEAIADAAGALLTALKHVSEVEKNPDIAVISQFYQHIRGETEH